MVKMQRKVQSILSLSKFMSAYDPFREQRQLSLPCPDGPKMPNRSSKYAKQAEAGRRPSVLNYPDEQRQKCDGTLKQSLEALHITTVLITSAIYSYRKFLIRNTYKYMKQVGKLQTCTMSHF